MFLYKQVKLFGYPLHPVVAGYPVAFYTATFASFVAYSATNDIFWFGVGYVANIAGLITAGIAFFPSFIDLVYLPDNSRVKTTGFFNFGFSLLAFFLFFVNSFLQKDNWNAVNEMPSATVPIVLSALGAIAALAAGFFGWKMIQKHHVGVDLTPLQQKMEPRDKDQLDQDKVDRIDRAA